MLALLLALISGTGLINGLVWLIILGVIFWLLWWLVGYIALPQPFDKVIRVILMLAAVIVLINFLLSLAGHPLISL